MPIQTLDNATSVKLAAENPDYGIQKLFEAIENKHTGSAPEDPYRARIEDVMGLLLQKFGDSDDVNEAEHLRSFRGGMTLEQAARHTGFILGFEYFRDLLLSDAAKKTGGAR